MLQTLAFAVDSLISFVMTWWRVLLPAVVGGAFGWHVTGYGLQQSPQILASLAGLGVPPLLFRLAGVALAATMAATMFNVWFPQTGREARPPSPERRGRDARQG